MDPTTGTPPPFRFAISRLGPTVVVTVHGKLDQRSTGQLMTVVGDAIHDRANRAVFVDLRDVSGVDSSAAKLFRDASEWALRRGVSFRLYGPPAALLLTDEDQPNALWTSSP